METEHAWSGQVLDQEGAVAWAARLQRAGQTVVFTNGCFDLLHLGHVDYLQRARSLGDALIVGLNNDAMVRQLKGPGRPILPEADRAKVLAALRAVDAVVVFHEPTAEALVAAVRPAIYVKGGDWGTVQRIPPEAAVVLAYGGRVEYVPYLAGRSTREIVAQIRS
jgi:D-glycero-beta-D-manno-heptose 1-phosphate adenylyltransferase